MKYFPRLRFALIFLAVTILASAAIVSISSAPAARADTYYPPPDGFTMMDTSNYGTGRSGMRACRLFETQIWYYAGANQWGRFIDLPHSWNVQYIGDLAAEADGDFYGWSAYLSFPDRENNVPIRMDNANNAGGVSGTNSGIATYAWWDWDYHTTYIEPGAWWYTHESVAIDTPSSVLLCYPAGYTLTTPTPTAAPTSTPYVGAAASICLTQTPIVTATVRATPTPYGTARPTATRNPALSPTPTVTATTTTTTTRTGWQQLEWSSTADFATGFQPWTPALSYTCPTCDPDLAPKATSWLSATGQDGAMGLVQIGGWGPHYANLYNGDDFINWRMNENYYDSVSGRFSPGAIILPLPTDISRPINISGYARTLNPPRIGSQIYVQVWYLDPGSPSTVFSDTATSTWISHLAYATQVSAVWNNFAFRITPDQSVPGWKAGKAQALLISWYVKWADNSSDAISNATMDGLQNAVQVDNIKVTVGDLADSRLPICSPDGSPLGTVVPLRTCVVNVIKVDMLRVCQAPTGLNIGEWLSYLWCNIWRFFGFFSENTAQVDAIIARQSYNEPFGFALEVVGVQKDLNSQVASLRAASPTRQQVFLDWASMMSDGSALNWSTLARFAVPDILGSQEYMSTCSQDVLNINASIASGACMGIYLMNKTVIVTFLQWGLNALFVVGILMMVKNDLEKLAS